MCIFFIFIHNRVTSRRIKQHSLVEVCKEYKNILYIISSLKSKFFVFLFYIKNNNNGLNYWNNSNNSSSSSSFPPTYSSLCISTRRPDLRLGNHTRIRIIAGYNIPRFFCLRTQYHTSEIHTGYFTSPRKFITPLNAWNVHGTLKIIIINCLSTTVMFFVYRSCWVVVVIFYFI